MSKSYRHLHRLKTFEDRFEYLRLDGIVGESTFGFDRYLNQILYHSREWKDIKSDIIIRDQGCDLAVEGFEIYGTLLVHHINPLTVEDIEFGRNIVFDPGNLITTSLATHNAIHFSNEGLLPKLPLERSKNDTCLWHRR